MPYEYLEDTATADVAFEAWNESLNGTFEAAWDATLNVMVEELESVEPRMERTVRAKDPDLDMLLFEFLKELVYHKDRDQLLLRVSNMRLERTGEGFELEAKARGERIDPERHEMRVDVKAVTLHRFTLEKRDGGWKTTVTLDI